MPPITGGLCWHASSRCFGLYGISTVVMCIWLKFLDGLKPNVATTHTLASVRRLSYFCEKNTMFSLIDYLELDFLFTFRHERFARIKYNFVHSEALSACKISSIFQSPLLLESFCGYVILITFLLAVCAGWKIINIPYLPNKHACLNKCAPAPWLFTLNPWQG